jgi:hypothetical protein
MRSVLSSFWGRGLRAVIDLDTRQLGDIAQHLAGQPGTPTSDAYPADPLNRPRLTEPHRPGPSHSPQPGSGHEGMFLTRNPKV